MDNKCCSSSRICSPALGMGFGITSGLMMMLFAWAAMWWGVGTTMMDQYSAIFYGYSATITGGLFGLLWGFIEGFLFGIISGWIYNMVARCCGCAKKSCACCSGAAPGSCK